MIVEDRRYKLFRISERTVLDLVDSFARAKREGFFYVGDYPELPKDAVVKGIHYDFFSRSFEILVYHPSFPAINDGANIPLACDHLLQCDLKRVRVEDADTPAVRGDS